MILAPVSPLLEGKALGRSLYGDGGEVLLTAGTLLTAAYIQRLLDIGILRAYVLDDDFPDVDAYDVVSERSRAQAIKVMSELARSAQVGDVCKRLSVSGRRVGQVVDALLVDLMSGPLTVATCVDLRSHDEYTYHHSANVCVIAMQLGRKGGIRGQKLRDLGLGALMHDVGKRHISRQILNKPSSLASDEFDTIRTHSRLGWEDLAGVAELGPIARSASLQHHERYDGGGYPKGLAGDDICWIARYVAVADVFDALTSDRPYRAGIPNHIVLRDYMPLGHQAFEPAVLQILHKIACPYPPGSWVALSSGDVAVVLKVLEGDLSRPVVRLEGEGGPTIELAQRDDLSIVGLAERQGPLVAACE